MSLRLYSLKNEMNEPKRLEKWNSIGNDFLITQNDFTKEEITLLSDRQFGIGCDQFIIQNNMEIKIFNSDGSPSEICGNALKCLSTKYFKKTEKRHFTFFIWDKAIEVIIENDTPCIQFPDFANFRKENISFFSAEDEFGVHDFYEIFRNENNAFFYVEVGNPHLICILNLENNIEYDKNLSQMFLSSQEIKEIINRIGINIQKQFPKTGGINISFIIKVAEDTLFIRTFERGVGETLSCGSAAVCAAFCSYKVGFISSNKVKLYSPGSKKFNEYSIVKIEEEKAKLFGSGTKIAEIILPNL